MDWKKDLNNIKKEKINDLSNNRGNINFNNNIDIRISNNSPLLKNQIRGGKKMITSDAAISDVDKLIEEAKDDKSTILILKSCRILLKFLSTIRSNQLLTEDDKRRIKSSRNKKTATNVDEVKK